MPEQHLLIRVQDGLIISMAQVRLLLLEHSILILLEYIHYFIIGQMQAEMQVLELPVQLLLLVALLLQLAMHDQEAEGVETHMEVIFIVQT